MIDNLSQGAGISVSTDFWSDKKKNSYLVLTGHYIDDHFNQKTTVLRFSTFPSRNYSTLIGREIEKQLTELNIFDKISTITCDGAPNMTALFDYLSRSDISRIQCLAHKLHLIICNGLKIWSKRTIAVQEADPLAVDIDEHRSQTVRTININEDVDNGESQRDDTQAINVSMTYAHDQSN
jgi:hypothetical protein